ncbi:cupin domain-containing protein [Kibdelosporangium philippinense]|uniref:Cupin domain-containing protein n=1 Tax=Kibdelosporangium philippinense TaxID=211113 RepID=A0ABS8Z5K6_9PSEU|nr:cupin domain-containing protein [Kibdelosporangium philippinense]MCE7001848.1 cupin domain-containing protein [Kibdelosporangium philippinense]
MTHFSTAGEGLELSAPDAQVTVKIDASHTGGAYEVFEIDAPRGPVTPPHGTPWPKSYYVLHGRMAVLVSGEIYDMGPGSSITIPPNAIHTFTVHTPSVRFLALSITDAMGKFFRELSTAENPYEVAGKHGIKVES